MNSTPVTPATPARTSTRRIEQPMVLSGLRLAWAALLIFQLISLSYLIPVNFRGGELNLLPQSSSYDGVYFLVTTVVSTVTSALMLALATTLMWFSRGERNAVLFSFVFLAAVTGGYVVSSTGVLPEVIVRARGITINYLLVVFYLFPDMRFTPGWMRYPFFGICLVIVVNYAFYSAMTDITSAVFFPSFLLGIGSYVYRFRRSAGIERQQLKWLVPSFVLCGVIIVTWFLVFLFVPASISADVQLVLGFLGTLVLATIPAAVGLAVLRYRLWDIDLLINRTLVYGTLTFLIVALFFFLLFLTQIIVGQTQPLVALLIAAPVAAIAFNPTQRFIQRQVDHRIYRLRYDLNEVAQAHRKPEIKNPGAFTGRFFGQYEALGVLGRGGMGEVYKGFGNHETVALKLLLPELARQNDFRQRFEREAQTLARLDHPNIVKLKASGVSDEVYFMAMEYIEGEELSAVIRRGAVSDYAALLRWLRGVASALDYIHAQGLVHRDLKSSNIMLRQGSGEALEAVLMDFGIARTDITGQRLTGTGVMGTIEYMAPEQIMAARDVDKRADVYALGVIVYELLAGERPFRGGAGQVLFAHLQQPPPDLRDTHPHIPREMARAVVKALAKNPDDRFASAGEFIAALSVPQAAVA
jgi:serine/threonine-protein kinase